MANSRQTPSLFRLLGWGACIALMLLIFGYAGMMVGGLHSTATGLIGTGVGLAIGFFVGHALGSALFFPGHSRDDYS